MTLTNNARVLPLLMIILFALSGCGIESSEVNQACLIYSGGLIEDQEFQEVLQPGVTSKSVGVGSTKHCYPNDQRSWVSDQDAPAIEVTTGDEVRMDVPYQLYFTLNTETEVLREFHERIGLKTDATTPQGWQAMLNTYFGPSIDKVMDRVALQFEWRDLRSDEDVRRQFQQQVVSGLRNEVRDVIGGDYFCGPAFVEGASCGEYTLSVGKPEPVNAGIVRAIEDEQISQTAVAAQRAENQRIDAEVDGARSMVDLYGREGAVCLRLAEVAEAAQAAPPPCFFGGSSPIPTVNVDTPESPSTDE